MYSMFLARAHLQRPLASIRCMSTAVDGVLQFAASTKVGVPLQVSLASRANMPSDLAAIVLPVDITNPDLPEAHQDLLTPLMLQSLKNQNSPLIVHNAESRLVLSPVGGSADLRASIHRGLECVRSQLPATTDAHGTLELPDVGVVLPRGASEKEFREASRTILLSSHRWDKYLQGTKRHKRVWLLDLFDEEKEAESRCEKRSEAFTQELAIAEGTLFARELCNERSALMTPSYVEKISLQLSEIFPNLSARVVQQAELQDRGFHLISAVGQAAADPPRIVLLQLNAEHNEGDLTALVGKGVTFDTGGLNLKPTGSIESMHMDMGGAAAVLGAMRALAMTGSKRRVVAALALAENAIGHSAYKPHAILQSKKGTVEVSNTDAEGRLCLADAMSLVQEDYSPSRLLDVATLTGACVVALGEYSAGLFSNNDQLASQLQKTGEKAFERCWRLPILPEHSAELKGDFSSLKSCGKGRNGGACTAAAFLQKFVGKDTAWAHIDIAGPAMYSQRRDYMPKDATGFGAQLLADYVRQL